MGLSSELNKTLTVKKIKRSKHCFPLKDFTFRNKDLIEGIKVIFSKNVTMSKVTKKFEKINKNYLFINSGFNLRPTDIQAAIGLSQFKSLNNFIKVRKINRKIIIKKIISDKRWKNQVNFLEKNDNVEPSWFALTMLLNKKFKNKKKLILDKLDKLGIENRPIISGNFLKQPALRKYKISQKSRNFPNASYVHEYGFFVGLKNKIMSSIEAKKFANIFFKSFG